VLLNPAFWRGRRVFLTGHTGFKGAWLALWLQKLGASVTAFSLEPPTRPSLFDAAGIARGMDSIHGDIRDFAALSAAMRASDASIVLHLAAQSLVAEGYRSPRETFAANLTGTVNLLDALRECSTVEAAIVVTSDKCYVPPETDGALTEDAAMGGRDPYSASKSCAEIAANCWRESFLSGAKGTRIASARSGNVIGGGDWSAHRLLPDMVRAWSAGEPLTLRMPGAIRPWQHVLEALAGYLLLADNLAGQDGVRFARGWNFGPAAADHLTVGEVAGRCARLWGDGARLERADANFQKETVALRLDATLAREALGWQPAWPLDEALRRTLDWYRAWIGGARDATSVRALTLAQIADYEAAS
jgi:CDP-glucose 4,6-dehydratase